MAGPLETPFSFDGKDPKAVKQVLMQQFEAWLDEILAEEQPPTGINRELLRALQGETSGDVGTDLASIGKSIERLREDLAKFGGNSGSAEVDLTPVTTALDGVRRELSGLTVRQDLNALANQLDRKLAEQEKALKELKGALGTSSGLSPAQLVDALKPVENAQQKQVGEMRQSFAQLQQELYVMRENSAKEAKEAAKEAAGSANKDLEVLMDVRERLIAGANTAHHSLEDFKAVKGPGFFGRVFGSQEQVWVHLIEAFLQLEKGYAATVERIGGEIKARGVQEINVLGQPFNNRTMRLVGNIADSGAAEGTVLEVVSPGYQKGTDVLRPAQVKVASSKANSERVPAPQNKRK